jgi:CRP-like cAMP-binding protein
MTNPLVELISQAEVFDQLTGAERQELSQYALRRTLKKGQILCNQGDDWPYVLYIAHGMLRSVINSPDGRSYVVGTWGKGEVFWSHTVFDLAPTPSTLEVIHRAELYQWQGEQILSVILRNPNGTRALLRRQTRLIRRRREVIYNLAFNPVASRLAKLIVEHVFDSDQPTVQRDLTLVDMAQMVATSPEVVCRLLYQFQDSGIISINRFSITLHDRQSLEKLVQRD